MGRNFSVKERKYCTKNKRKQTAGTNLSKKETKGATAMLHCGTRNASLGQPQCFIAAAAMNHCGSPLSFFFLQIGPCCLFSFIFYIIFSLFYTKVSVQISKKKFFKNNFFFEFFFGVTSFFRDY